MLKTTHQKASKPQSLTGTPPSENGDELRASEFLRRYMAMLEITEVEISEATAHPPPPVGVDQGTAPDTISRG